MSAKDKRRQGTTYFVSVGCRITGTKQEVHEQLSKGLAIARAADLEALLSTGNGRWWEIATWTELGTKRVMMSVTLVQYFDGTPVVWTGEGDLVPPAPKRLETKPARHASSRITPDPARASGSLRGPTLVLAAHRGAPLQVELMAVGSWYKLVPPPGLTAAKLSAAVRSVLAWLAHLGGNHVAVDPDYDQLAILVSSATKRSWTAWSVELLVLDMASDDLAGVYTLTDGHQLVWMTVSGCHEHYKGQELEIIYTGRAAPADAADEPAA